MGSISQVDSFQHAIVIGGSIAGLMTAKVLSNYFQQVTVIEKDAWPDGPNLRKGVPQSAHIHVLLESGQNIIEEFYPGISAEMQANGANVVDCADQVAWFHHGVWKTRYHSGVKLTLATRVLVEWHIRKRTEQIQNIRFMNSTVVENLLISEDNKTIQGVAIHESGDSQKTTELKANLVVDASGRSSRVPAWLKKLGYVAPKEESIEIDLTYTTRMYKRPETFKQDWQFMLLYPKAPFSWRAGFMSCVENNKWIVSLNGYFKDGAPNNDVGFIDFAASLSQPCLHRYITNATPITELRVIKIPKSRWLHYEKLKYFPENLINLGDSVCAFNPIFGQGMSVAAKSALLLQQQMDQQLKTSPNSLQGLANRFRKALPSAISLPWFLASVLDLMYPKARGKKPPAHRFLAWYVGKILELSSVDEAVYRELVELLNLNKGLWVVLKPTVSLKVFAYGIKSYFVVLENRANTNQAPFILEDVDKL